MLQCRQWLIDRWCLCAVEGALRAGPDADPPANMHRALIFQGALVCSAVVWVLGLRGTQTRRELDERILEEAKHGISMDGPGTPPV